MGRGAFRKRIIEMGFIRGKEVDVIQNAPLKDPIHYRVMGYDVSLRRNDAQMIEVVSVAEFIEASTGKQENRPVDSYIQTSGKSLQAMAMHKGKTINVALVGNPNCGKTSLFNFASGAHEHVGNYSGVTVDAKAGTFHQNGYTFKIVDLPGTYSLSAYTPEELYVRKHLNEEQPDIVINVVDASNLERNLYLTCQLIDMDVRMVIALNMYDELERHGNKFDHNSLSRMIGTPIVPTISKTGFGIEELFNRVIKVYEEEDPVLRHIHINYGDVLEKAIYPVRHALKLNGNVSKSLSKRYLAIKLLEGDPEVESFVKSMPGSETVIHERDRNVAQIETLLKEDCETAFTNARYGFISGALRETYEQNKIKEATSTQIIDLFVTHKVLGFPIFILFMWIMFEATFRLGEYPMEWIESFVGWIGEFVRGNMSEGPLKDLLVDGIIGGVGGVIVFLPNILILYAFISFMEDSGYMARAAFIMDKLMHKMGLHGKSFIPLIMGFGCNVPAIMATRTVESRRSRLVTMLLVPLMSCEARIPVYVMVIVAFFRPHQQPLVMMSLYLLGMLLAVVMSKIFTSFVFKGEDTPFVMELPPYRFPTWKAVGRHTWEKGRQYLKKMGGIILCATIIVWALGYFPHNEQLGEEAQQEQSYIGQIGHAVEPVFTPQGFNWKLDIGLVAGVGAKEVVASTMGVLYSNDSRAFRSELQHDVARQHGLSYDEAGPLTTLTAYCFLLFVLLYFPCIATVAAIKGETGSWRWALFAAGYTTLLAWVVSALVFQVGRLLLV